MIIGLSVGSREILAAPYIDARFVRLEHWGGRPQLMRIGCWLFRTSNQRSAMCALWGRADVILKRQHFHL
jgi:hypothetical protein